MAENKKDEPKKPNAVEEMAAAKSILEEPKTVEEVLTTKDITINDFPEVAKKKAERKPVLADKDKPIVKWLCYITGGMDSAFLIANQLQPQDFDNSYKLNIVGACLKLANDANKEQVAACKYICDRLGAELAILDVNSSNPNDVYDPNVYGLKLYEYAKANGITHIALNFNNDELAMLKGCNQSVVNGLNQQCIEANSTIRFHIPISGQAKGIIVKMVKNSLKFNLSKLFFSKIEDKTLQKQRGFLRMVGFVMAGEEDPLRSKYEDLLKKGK